MGVAEDPEFVEWELEQSLQAAMRRLEDRLGPVHPSVLPEELARLAATQGDVFRLDQAKKAGLDRTAVRRLLRTGALVALRRGVYAEKAVVVAANPLERHDLDAAAVVAALGDAVAVSHESAARVWRLDLCAKPSGLFVTRPARAQSGTQHEAGVVIRHAGLPAAHVRTERGIRVTSAARTVVDLARLLPFREGVVVADCALHLGRCSPTGLGLVLLDCTTWPGAGRAGRVLRFADRRSESPLESISRVAFHEAGFPMPEPQRWVGHDLTRYRVDFLWEEYRTIGEADGRVKYTDVDVAWDEKRRQDDLHDLDYEVVRWTWKIDSHPDQVIEAVMRTFDRAIRRFNLDVALPSIRFAGRRSS